MLDDQTHQALLEHYEETLNNRIIETVAESLSESQLQELSHMKTVDSQVLQEWLLINVPELDEIIEGEVAILMGDIAEGAESF